MISTDIRDQEEYRRFLRNKSVVTVRRAAGECALARGWKGARPNNQWENKPILDTRSHHRFPDAPPNNPVGEARVQ